MPTNKQPEQALQKQAVQLYEHVIHPMYPDSLLIANPLSSISLGPQGGRIMANMKRSGLRKGQPDILIICKREIESRESEGTSFKGLKRVRVYSGLAIELKAEDANLWKKNGQLATSEHLSNQAAWLEKARVNGWMAEFAQGLDEVIALYNLYFHVKIV